MPKFLQKGIIHIPILIIAALIGIGVVGMSVYVLEPWDYLQSPEQVIEELLDRPCLWQWERKYAQQFIDEQELDQYQAALDQIEPCRMASIIQRLNPRQVIVDTSRDEDKDLPNECWIWAGGGSRLYQEREYPTPNLYEEYQCYDVVNTRTHDLIQEEKCDTFIGTSEEGYAWYLDWKEKFDKEKDCIKFWDEEESEIPVGFPDQYDFSDYQTEDYEPPLEPLDTEEAPEPELEPLSP